MKDKIKPNVLYIATLSFLAFIGIGSVLTWGSMADAIQHEIQLILAAALGASGTAFLALGSQVATNDPPNAHRDLLNALTPLADKILDKFNWTK